MAKNPSQDPSAERIKDAAAEANSRKARELSLIAYVREAVAEPADSLDEIYGKLLA